MTVTITLPWLLLGVSVVLIVGGIAAAAAWPQEGSNFMPSTPGCFGLVLLLIGVALGLVVLGIWLGGGFS